MVKKRGRKAVNRFIVKNKEGQASTLTIVLLVLIGVIIVAILWNILVPLIGEKSEEIQFGKF